MLQDKDNIHKIENEIEILKGLRHDNIVELHEYGSDGCLVKSSQETYKNCVYIIMEMVDDQTLFDLIEKRGHFSEVETRHIAHQLISTLKYMHNLGVVHRDLKLENIVFGKDKRIKVADFGFASYKNIKCMDTFLGTKSYMAPEIWKR